ncbi:DNA sulfur modification protein DndB [Vibrio crassostreae]|uniref:DNA sulfur modification protein DndB n=1 Tax=Vibrio crassostreae TaxID=246167 RepID=UPI000636F0F1|nr:DNA sulfur modification protein DndB [Vibrio crassostreae]CDT76800.1 conserved exported hypothetical protein [Vibrio crassostreae]
MSMKTNALTLNSPFSYTFPSTAGMQHKRYQQINVPARTLVKMLRLDDAGSTMDRSQRSVNETRAKAFADYLINNIKSGKPFIWPTITGVIDTPVGAPEPQFYNAGDLLMKSGVQSVNMAFNFVGALVVSMDAEFKLFDGQHRSRGGAIALERVSKDEELAKLVDLTTLMIPLMAYTDLTLEERQIFFSDINGNMAKPAASISIAYDHRDPVAKFAVELSQELPFKDLVDFERNTISKKSEFLFPLKTIKDSITSLLGLSKSHSEELTAEQKEFVIKTFSTFSRHMGWSALSFDGVPAATFRETSILTHTVMTKAIVEAAKVINAQFPSFEGAPIENLSTLDYGRHSSDFEKRCIDNVTGNMLMNKTGVTLTANLLIKTVGCALSPEHKQVEKMYFDIEEAAYTSVETLTKEDDQQLITDAIDKKDIRTMVVIASGSTEKKPAAITRAVNTFAEVANKYEEDSGYRLMPLVDVIKDKIRKVEENEGDKASWKMVSNKNAIALVLLGAVEDVY